MMGDEGDIAIFGPGAVGLALGAGLVKSGMSPMLIARRPEAAEQLRYHGIVVVQADQRVSYGPVRAFSSTEPLPANIAGCVLLTTKAQDIAAALPLVLHILRPDGVVIVCSNGIDFQARLVEAVGVARACVGVLYLAAARLGPGVVRCSMIGNISLGRYAVPGYAPVLQPLADTLTQGGFTTTVCTDIKSEIWAKLTFNCLVNGAAAIYRCTIGDLVAEVHLRVMLKRLLAEIYAVAKAEGVIMPYPSPEEYWQYFESELAVRWKTHFPSMVADVMSGTPTEIDALNGAVLRLGEEKHHLPMVMHRAVTRAIKRLGERPLTSRTVDAARAQVDAVSSFLDLNALCDDRLRQLVIQHGVLRDLGGLFGPLMSLRGCFKTSVAAPIHACPAPRQEVLKSSLNRGGRARLVDDAYHEDLAAALLQLPERVVEELTRLARQYGPTPVAAAVADLWGVS